MPTGLRLRHWRPRISNREDPDVVAAMVAEDTEWAEYPPPDDPPVVGYDEPLMWGASVTVAEGVRMDPGTPYLMPGAIPSWWNAPFMRLYLS